MPEILEILKYLLPSLVVFITTWYLVRKYFESERSRQKQQQILNNQNMITPLRLQAYERIIIFLERIAPESLIMRVNKSGYTCQHLQTEMLDTIRSEFEHNLSQQIYVSHAAWEMVKAARATTIQLINNTAGKVQKESPSINLSKAILESLVESEKEPCADALRMIKKEIGQLFE
ncbi:MAG: hypothetical protein JXA61_09075 [Bacteroidales bacterium]|nr:hypothetical protein [Bacteroidales bacterium]